MRVLLPRTSIYQQALTLEPILLFFHFIPIYLFPFPNADYLIYSQVHVCDYILRFKLKATSGERISRD